MTWTSEAVDAGAQASGPRRSRETASGSGTPKRRIESRTRSVGPIGLAAALALVVGAGEPVVADPAYSVGVCVAHPQWNPCLDIEIAEGTLAQVGPQPTPASLNGGRRLWYTHGMVETVNYGLHSIHPDFNTSSTWVIADTGPDRIEGTMYSGASNGAMYLAANEYTSACGHDLILDDLVFTNTSYAGTEFTAALNLNIASTQTLDIDTGGTNDVSLTVSVGPSDVVLPGNYSGTVQFDLGTLTFDTPYTLGIGVSSKITSVEDGTEAPVLASQVTYAVEFVSAQVFALPAGITANSSQGNIVNNTWNLPPPPECPGDLDGDGATSVLDFGTLAANFGRNDLVPGTGGDMDFDGDCDVFDFPTWSADLGCGT